MKKVDNLFPVLFATAGILFVVWGISAGEAVSETASSEAESVATERQSDVVANSQGEPER